MSFSLSLSFLVPPSDSEGVADAPEECEEAEEAEEADDDNGPDDGAEPVDDIMITMIEHVSPVENENRHIRQNLLDAFGAEDGFYEEPSVENDVEASMDIVENEGVSDSPVHDFDCSGVLAKSFPTLFPFGIGDVTCESNRGIKVSFNDGMKHYVRYYDANREVYHFSGNHRFLHYIQDMDERHRIQGQAATYLRLNEADANMKVRELVQLVNNPTRFAEYNCFVKRLDRFTANINGSSSYMYNKKRDLLTLMEQEESANIWFTLTLPNWLWKDMQIALGDSPDQKDDEDFDEYLQRCNEHYKKLFNDNAQVVNELFVRKARVFVAHFFGPKCLPAKWFWYRFEWQKRGNIHLHGLANVEIMPVQALAKAVAVGRKNLEFLRILSSQCQEYADMIGVLEDGKEYDDIDMTEMLQSAKDVRIDEEIVRSLKQKVLFFTLSISLSLSNSLSHK